MKLLVVAAMVFTVSIVAASTDSSYVGAGSYVRVGFSRPAGGGSYVGAGFSRPDAPGSVRNLPQHLSGTGLYRAGTLDVDPRNRPFSPQYPLWSDGAAKSRWVWLPEGAPIDARDIDRWAFPVGTRFWKEFAFGGRRVETRMLERREDGWAFASYVWNDAQTDAALAPVEGVLNVAAVGSGKQHSIPSVDDCKACHVSNRVEVLGFTALQLSTDRDPGAPHAEPLAPGMVTAKTLVEEGRFEPARPELVAMPPRIDAPDARTRSVLGYLATNCGSCHSGESTIADLGLLLKAPAYVSRGPAHDPVRALLKPTRKWQVPGTAEGAGRFVEPASPDLSAILVRMRSRRPSTQMPPLGTVVQDREAVDLIAAWIREFPFRSLPVID